MGIDKGMVSREGLYFHLPETGALIELRDLFVMVHPDLRLIMWKNFTTSL
jgi:hypothetical protein